MKVFEFDNYKKFVREKIKSMPKGGHGQFLKVAKLLNIHTTMVTHIFKGDSNLSVEQGLKICEYFGLNALETEYFIDLIHLERSGNSDSKEFYKKQLSYKKVRAQNLSERIEVKKVLDEKDQAVFYSNWYYSGIRLLSDIQKFQSPDSIAERLKIPVGRVNEVLEFLISRGLCVEENGKVKVGQTRTFVGRESPLVSRHHINWRMKVMQGFDSIPNEHLVFTNPIVISEKDFEKIREKLIQFVEEFRKISDPSPSEQMCCLNIDWVKI